MGPKRIERRAVSVEDVECAITVNVKQRLVSLVPGPCGKPKGTCRIGTGEDFDDATIATKIKATVELAVSRRDAAATSDEPVDGSGGLYSQLSPLRTRSDYERTRHVPHNQTPTKLGVSFSANRDYSAERTQAARNKRKNEEEEHDRKKLKDENEEVTSDEELKAENERVCAWV